MKTYIAIIAFFGCYSFSLQAQFFVPKLTQDEMTQYETLYVVDNAGDTIHGKLMNTSYDTDRLKSFTLKTDGGKRKFKTADAKVLAVKPWIDPDQDSGPISLPNLMRATDPEFNAIVITDWVFYEKVQLPTKKEKYAFIQLLNPGFDSKIKIYVHQNADKTATLEMKGITLAGDDDQSHLVVINGGKSELIRKRNYKDQALSKLYKDCNVIKEMYAGDKFRWKDFAKHVFIYDQKCK